jgi:hypothetical protein
MRFITNGVTEPLREATSRQKSRRSILNFFATFDVVHG